MTIKVWVFILIVLAVFAIAFFSGKAVAHSKSEKNCGCKDKEEVTKVETSKTGKSGMDVEASTKG